MSKIILLILPIIISIIFLSNKLSAETAQYGVKYNSGTSKNELYEIEANGTATLKKSWRFTNNSWTAGDSYADTTTGIIYMFDNGGSNFVTYNPSTDTLTKGVQNGYVAGYQKLFPKVESVNDIIENTTVGGESVTKIKNKNIVDNDGKTMIKVTEDGATHIGENSLVTQEVNGVQDLYATDASGNMIDINIKRGSNLLIDGVNVMTHISNSTALSSALSSLPTSVTGDALYSCGIGYGNASGSTAMSTGCAMDLDNFRFTDEWHPFFKSASFNVGGSSIVNGVVDEKSVRMGLTFAFGSASSDRDYVSKASLSETDYDLKVLKNKTKMQQANIQKLELKLEKMNEELLIARNHIVSNELINLRLEKLEKKLNLQLAALN